MSASDRQLSPVDRLITHADRALRTLTSNTHIASRRSPGDTAPESELSDAEKRHAAGLMRVNHAGEVCAQALYQGQAITAKGAGVRAEMVQAAEEETDHLAWCEQRLRELHDRPSKLNPIWYALSFGLGAGAGLVSDKVSLGFVAATEDQVCVHLKDHLRRLPEHDVKSRAIVKTMLADEQRHGNAALRAGGLRFPKPVKFAMRLVSKAMTGSSYRI